MTEQEDQSLPKSNVSDYPGDYPPVTIGEALLKIREGIDDAIAAIRWMFDRGEQHDKDFAQAQREQRERIERLRSHELAGAHVGDRLVDSGDGGIKG